MRQSVGSKLAGGAISLKLLVDRGVKMREKRRGKTSFKSRPSRLYDYEDGSVGCCVEYMQPVYVGVQRRSPSTLPKGLPCAISILNRTTQLRSVLSSVFAYQYGFSPSRNKKIRRTSLII